MSCCVLGFTYTDTEVKLAVLEWGRGFVCGLGRGALRAVTDLGFYEEWPSERCIPPPLPSPLVLPFPSYSFSLFQSILVSYFFSFLIHHLSHVLPVHSFLLLFTGRGSQIQLRGLGNATSSPAGSGAELGLQPYFVIFLSPGKGFDAFYRRQKGGRDCPLPALY